MKRRVILVCLAIILVAATFGCGGGDDGRSELEGRWEANQGFEWGSWIEFTGNSFRSYMYDTHPRIPESGTFSISDDRQIEFIGDDGWIVAYSFLRTENTITIQSGWGGVQFVRAR